MNNIFSLATISQIMYGKAALSVRVVNEQTKFITVTEGLLQGGFLSLTFLIILCQILNYFFRERYFVGYTILANVGFLILLYADDIIILADTLADANRNLLALRKYCSLKKMTVYIDQTKAMIFKRVSYFNYVGLTFSRTALFAKASDLAVSRTEIANASVLRIIARTTFQNSAAIAKKFLLAKLKRVALRGTSLGPVSSGKNRKNPNSISQSPVSSTKRYD